MYAQTAPGAPNKPAAAADGIELTCRSEGDLGNVNLDPERILQVLTNLVGNALKFTARGGHITIQARRLDDAVCFSVTDTGSGIPTELLEKAYCIVIVPELKTAAFGVGGKYGKGYVSCRTSTGRGWSAPGAVRIEGGSVGFQIGGSSTDVSFSGGADRCKALRHDVRVVRPTRRCQDGGPQPSF